MVTITCITDQNTCKVSSHGVYWDPNVYILIYAPITEAIIQLCTLIKFKFYQKIYSKTNYDMSALKKIPLKKIVSIGHIDDHWLR